MAFPLVTGGATRRTVRKHRAPKGALRHSAGVRVHSVAALVRKHRAPKGALRPVHICNIRHSLCASQKAPSAKRCIKTPSHVQADTHVPFVRKHRAPKGALRLHCAGVIGLLSLRQKAPSAKRCIKTALFYLSVLVVFLCQKAPSAKRCIKTSVKGFSMTE